MCLCVEKQSNIIRRNSSNYLRPKPIHNRANNKYFENNIVKQQNKYLGSQFINRAKLIQKSATSVMNSFAGTVMTTNRSSEIIIPEWIITHNSISPPIPDKSITGFNLDLYIG